MTESTHTYRVFRNANGEYRISVDAPGVAAVSAPFEPAKLITEIAKLTGITIHIGDTRIG